MGPAVPLADADPEADALADAFARFFLAGDGDGGGENVAYS